METLTVPDFETRYGREKPYYEFWHGEAVQKAMPTWIHGLLQQILMELSGIPVAEIWSALDRQLE